MKLFRWFSSHARSKSRPVRKTRLCLEPLEARDVPANLVVNGGFELPANTPPGGFVTYFGGDSFTGWSVGGHSVDVHDTGHTSAHSGQQSLDVSGEDAGSITQTIATVPGARYLLSFWASGHVYHPYDGDAFADVVWNGNTVRTVQRAASPDTVNMNWQQERLTLTATSTSTTLAFVSLSPNGGVILDDISLERILPSRDETVPTPETAPPVKDIARVGFELVVLAKWSLGQGGSVQNFLDAVTDPQGPEKLEIAFASRLQPATDNTHFESEGFARAAYARAVKMVEALANAGKDVNYAVYFGLHDKFDAAVRRTYQQTLDAQTRYLRRYFLNATVTVNGERMLVKNVPNLALSISPSLEDNYPTTARFAHAVARIAGHFTASELHNVTFRRSSTSADALNATSTVSFTTLDNVVMNDVAIIREFHGPLSLAAPFEVYSNDGQFIYSPWDLNHQGGVDENSESAENADYDAFPTRPSLGQFLRDLHATFAPPGEVARTPENLTINLWRPAYNLFDVNRRGAGTARSPELLHYKIYVRGIRVPLASRADGHGSEAKFSKIEQNFVRVFAGVPLG